MARINAVLGGGINYGFNGGARYKTVISETTNGLEDRDSLWKWPKYEFEASYEYLDDEARDVILDYIHVCKGKMHSFMFKDWNDYEIVNQPIVVGAAGTRDPIQIYKRYSLSIGYQIRPIQALNTLTVVDALGAPVAGIFDPLTGIFTPTNDWADEQHTISECTFYVWVRFGDDYNPMTLYAPNATKANISLHEDPFPFAPVNVPDGWDA